MSLLKSVSFLACLLITTSAVHAETLRIGLPSEATSVDPHFHNLNPNNQVAAHIYDSLIGQDESQRLLPGLATEWTALDDTTWEFKLRENVTFHDGSPFTADDVLCSFERAPNVPNSPSSFSLYTRGKTLTKIDDYTIRITTENPYPLMANEVSTIFIVSKASGCDATTAEFNSGDAAIGTGPFELSVYKPGETITLKRNDGYWGKAPIWESVELIPVKSAPSRVAALLAGDVDMIAGVPTTDIETIKGRDGIALSQGLSNLVVYLHMDQFRDASPFVKAKDGGAITNPLKDRRVRLAISKAINREAIVERVMEGVAVPAGQLLPEGFFGVSSKLSPLEYDPEGAKALLKEAGYADGFALTIHGPNDRYVNDAQIAEAIAQMLTRIGIETEVETMPRSIYFKRASRGGENDLPEFSFILVGWGADSGEASNPLKALVHSYDADAGFGSSNRGRYANPKADALIEEALRTVDDGKRQDLLAQVTELAMEDVAIIPLHYQVNTWALREGLNYTPRSDEHTRAADVGK